MDDIGPLIPPPPRIPNVSQNDWEDPQAQNIASLKQLEDLCKKRNCLYGGSEILELKDGSYVAAVYVNLGGYSTTRRMDPDGTESALDVAANLALAALSGNPIYPSDQPKDTSSASGDSPLTPIPATWSGSHFNILSWAASGKALDAASSEDGVAVHLWDNDKSNGNQNWQFNLVPGYHGRMWTLMNASSTHYLEIENGSVDNGVVACTRQKLLDSDAKRHIRHWFIYFAQNKEQEEGSTIVLQNVVSGTFLNLSGDDQPPKNGSKIHGWEYNDSDNCKWSLVKLD